MGERDAMPYALPTDILVAWPKVHTSSLTDDELRVQISRAGNLIDGMLTGRYVVPFTTEPTSAPPLIRDLTVDLAMLDVLDRAPNTPDWIVRRITRAQEKLGLLADGTMEVPGVVNRVDQGAVLSNTSGYTPVFGGVPSGLEGFDRDRVQAEQGARGFAGVTTPDWP